MSSEEFPSVCETCLGDDPYVRMSKQPNGYACQICKRAMTLFKWKAGKGRMKETIICHQCSKIKNVCQTCLLDLEFGIPVAARDKFLTKTQSAIVPTSQVGRTYQAEHYDALVASGQKVTEKLSAIPEIKKVMRSAPYYERNKAKLCTFYAKGTCTRGELCPFRHELPVHSELATKSIADRYHGRNDPVAEKILLNK